MINKGHEKISWFLVPQKGLQLFSVRGLAGVAVHFRADLSLCNSDAAVLFSIHHSGRNHVEYLTNVEHHTQDGCPHHEVGKNGFLSGSRHVAVDQIWTGADIALNLPGQLKAIVDVVEQVEKSDLETSFDEEAHQVRPPQAAMLLSRVVVEPSVLAVLGSVLAFPFFPVSHVEHHHEWRASDENKLEGPKANVGDGEEVIITDVGATRLTGVAVEVPLLVAPDSLSSHHEDQHPENKDHW